MMSHFDEAAGNWDTPERIMRAKIIAAKIDEKLEFSGTESVLEFGCGTGLISFALKDRAREFVLLDTSEGMINVIEKKIRQTGIAHFQPVCSSLSNAFQPDRRFDIIISSMAVHHVDDVEETLLRFRNLLSEGGRICIVDLTEDNGLFHAGNPDFQGYNGFNPDGLLKMALEKGFSNGHVEVFLHDSRLVDGKKHDYSLFCLTLNSSI